MDYRSIMVCLDESEESRARLEYALGLARRCNATLAAVHVAWLPSAPWVMGADILLTQVGDLVREAQETARQDFREAAERAEVNGEFIAIAGSDLVTGLCVARTVDLIVAGPREDGLAAPVSGNLALRALLGAGRPVLFLPAAARAPASFENILIAWNDSREAARAVADAMPFLKAAAHVSVVSVQRLDGTAPDYRASGRRLVSSLGRHGVQAVFTAIDTESTGLAADEWLCRQNRDAAGDLLVAGGYGHARMAEMVLGGTTHTLLHVLPGPVLMSH